MARQPVARKAEKNRWSRWQRALAQIVDPGLVKDPEVRELASQSSSLYRARCDELPCGGPTVSGLIAEGARSTVLSARYAHKALELGLDTPDGQKAMELSMKLGVRAERTALAAYDMSLKLGALRGVSTDSPHAVAAQLFGSPANDTATSQRPANPAESQGWHRMDRPVTVDAEPVDPGGVPGCASPTPQSGLTPGGGGVAGAPSSSKPDLANTGQVTRTYPRLSEDDAW